MPLKIALDPGHGGSNSGLNYEGFLEKNMTRVTAQAMKEELEKYEGVEVVITAPEVETDMSLKGRADFAKEAGADVLISLHFNMSEEHTMFGSEVWIPCNGVEHADMRSLGELVLDQFSDAGLTIRGTKVRLNDRGTDYYGIIRESIALDMPALLIEHCYADHEQDREFVTGEDNWKAFGKMDATAVAQYYHLKSKDGQTDYTGFVKNGYMAPEEAVRPDKTGPEAVSVTWLANGETDANETGIQHFHIQGNEPETSIVYYDYTLDGGETWSGLMPFAKGETQMDIEIPEVKPGADLQVRLYNGYTVSGSSNVIRFKPAPEAEQIDADRDLESLDAAYESSTGTLHAMERALSVSRIWSWAGTALAAFCMLGFAAAVIEKRALTKRRKNRGREAVIRERTQGNLPTQPLRESEILEADLQKDELQRERAKDRKRSRHLGRLMLAWSLAAMFLLVGAWMPRRLLKDARSEAETNVQMAYDSREDARRINAGHDELRKEQERQARELILIDKGETEGEYAPKQEVKTVTVYDIAKGYMKVPLVEGIATNPHKEAEFSGEGLAKTAPGAVLGIDVSKFQGDIDWQAVAGAGVKFVIIRLGSRGYETGELVMDDKFTENIEGALEAGLKVGVYFFSTAVSEREAVAEANYVLDAIAGYQVSMPVVFDTEIITYAKSRNAGITPNTLTAVTKAFCERIRGEGLTPMIYSNAKRLTTRLHLEELEGYDKWLADYRSWPDYPYAFKMWQYSETGSVPGISGNVDLDLYFE